MPSTPKMGWIYPAEGQEPFFDIIERFFLNIDTSAHAHREDRNIIVTGGGVVAWDASTGNLSWTEDIEIWSPIKGYMQKILVASSPVSLSAGQAFFVQLTRNPGAAIILTVQKGNVLPANDNSYMLALRSGTTCYLRNGGKFEDGESGTILGNTSPSMFYESVFIPIGDMIDGSSAPAALATISSSDGYANVRKFDGASAEDVRLNWKVPDDIVVSEKLDYRVIALVTEGTGPSSEGVVFNLSGYSIGDGDGLSATLGSAVSASKTGLTLSQYDLIITGWATDVTLTNLAAGELAILKLERDPTDGDDTYAQDVGVIGIEIRYKRQPA